MIRNEPVLVELSPSVYLTLCGLVRDALEVDSDAAPFLQRAANELMTATAGGMIPSELAEQPEQLETLRRAGFVA